MAFEAAGRHANFSRAADELHVSQAAVSRRIRELEERLGITLFVRLHRSVALTQSGERLHAAVAFGFDHIADTISRLEQMHGARHVGVAANNAVAFYWLRQRVTAYQQAHQDVHLAVFASDRDAGFDEEGIDLAIRYGTGEWPDASAMLLFEEALFPVCAPDYLATAGRPVEPADLLDGTLLYMDPQGPDWVTWNEWFRSRDVQPGTHLPPGTTFNSYPVLLQAALEGEGFALGTAHLVDPLIAEGKLVRPLAAEYRTGRGYYLALPRSRAVPEAVRGFADWLITTVKG